MTVMLQRLSVPIAWAITIVVFGILRPDSFLTVPTFASILGSDAVLVFLTLGLVITLRAGDYDLSVASILTLSAMVLTILNVNHHLSVWLCVAIALGVGAVVGAINGIITVFIGVDSFIATLGVGTFISGVVLWISNGTTYNGVSQSLIDLVVGKHLLRVPLEFYYALGLCLILWYIFEFTGIGRQQLFVGKGQEVARLSGISVVRVRFWSFVATGTMAAAAGVLYAGTAGGADPDSGMTFLLPAFAAAFLGSTTIKPGEFNPIGALVSAYFLVTGITALQILGVQNYVTDLFYGGALIIAVAATSLSKKRPAWRRLGRAGVTAPAAAAAEGPPPGAGVE